MAGGPYKRTNDWQVKWREESGGRTEWQSESFALEHEAHTFKYLVEQAGNHWPVDAQGRRWVKGRGFVVADQAPPAHPFLAYAEKRIVALRLAERIGDDTATKYRSYARIIAGSMQVAPDLYERIQDNADLALLVAQNPALAEGLLDEITGGLDDAQLAESVKGVVVEDLTVDAIRAFIFWMRVRKRTWKTIANYHGFLHGVLEQAFDEDLVRRNPTKVTTRELGKKTPVRKKVVLAPEQFWLVHSCMAPDQRDFILCAVGTGTRFSELSASRACDWFPDEKRLRVEEAWKRGLPGQGVYRGKPKTDAGIRDVFVTDDIAEILTKHAEGKADDDLLFTARLGGRIRQNVFNEEKWKQAIDRAVKAGLPERPRFHDLRHTYVAWLRGAEVDELVIKSMVGHADVAMTEKYGDVPVALMQQAAERVGRSMRRLQAV